MITKQQSHRTCNVRATYMTHIVHYIHRTLLAISFALVSASAVSGQATYSAVNTLPPTCTVGSIAVTINPYGIYNCLVTNIWTANIPAVVVNNGPVLPSTCIVGSVFTVIPSGSLWTCPITNQFVPVGNIVAAKTILGIQNNVFTDVLTVTVPNLNVGAVIEVTLSGSLGAGGAVGEFESTIGRSLLLSVTRVAGLATNVSITTASNSTIASVVGAAGITQTTQVSVISGLNTATQTFTLQYRITRGSGASNNHIAAVRTSISSPAPTTLSIQ